MRRKDLILISIKEPRVLIKERVLNKARPNDRNISMQHITTLLAGTCYARLATLLRCVATSCDMLGVVGLNLQLVKFLLIV